MHAFFVYSHDENRQEGLIIENVHTSLILPIWVTKICTIFTK